MSKRVIRFSLSPEGIDHAIEELERFKKDMREALAELIEQLGLRAVDSAVATITANTDGYTDNLVNSFSTGEKEVEGKRVYFVRNDCYYAAFVEFGTGIVGGEHPEADLVGWQKNASGKGKTGWPFENPAKGDETYWTHGQPPKAFMYNAYMTIRNEAGGYTATIFAKL